MASNEDKIDAILNQMEKENDPQALSEGLNILSKLTSKYLSNNSALSKILSSPSTDTSKPPITPSKPK